MPEYRKKRRNRLLASHPRGKAVSRKKEKDSDIKMYPDNARKTEKNVKTDKMRVVRGKKVEKKKKISFFTAFIGVVLILLLILQVVFPAGILRTARNAVALIGTGGYPIELESSDTIDVKPMGNYYYVLSSTQLSAYSNSGKKLFSFTHGFENPILKTSAFGALIFNQSDNSVYILNLQGDVKTVEIQKNVITAAISDSGAYALVTESDSYACAVSVYNKNGKNLYEWYSAEGMVNNLAVSPNGKKIALSSYKTSGGEFVSTVNVFNYKSADPEHSFTVEGNLVYDLSSTAKGYFTVTTANSIKFIKWSNYKQKEHKNDYNVSHLRTASHGTVAVWGRESNPNDNKVTVFSKSGKLKCEFNFGGIISDIRLFGGNIYCMSDTEIYMLSETGEVLRKASIGFGGVKTVVVGTGTVLCITDNKVEKIKLEQEQKK